LSLLQKESLRTNIACKRLNTSHAGPAFKKRHKYQVSRIKTLFLRKKTPVSGFISPVSLFEQSPSGEDKRNKNVSGYA
jgi:hypothetical protein